MYKIIPFFFQWLKKPTENPCCAYITWVLRCVFAQSYYTCLSECGQIPVAKECVWIAEMSENKEIKSLLYHT